MFTHVGTQLHKKMLAIIACVVLCVSVCTYIGVFVFEASLAQAAFNEQINYQGKLTGTTNIAVADGTYNMRFWLLQSTGQATTSAVWTESLTGTNRVQVTNGLFSIMLGSSTPFTGVDFNQTLYLGVEIGGTAGVPAWDGEMSPRKILGAVPAAFEAKNLGGASSTQYLRADGPVTLASTTASTLLTIIQNGTGDLLNIFDGVNEVFSILDGGNVGVGSSSPTLARFVVGGDSYFGGNVTATGTLALSGLGTFNSGFVSNASSSISRLSVQFGTTTNATSTNLFTTNLNTTNATTTNFFTTVFGATNGLFTNSTSTNLFASLASTTNIRASNASSTNLYLSGIAGIGTTSASAKLSIQANIGDTNTNIFAIGSSTASANTTLLTVDNTGTAVFAGNVYSKGVTWTVRSVAGNNDAWTNITYGNGLFVAVSDSNDKIITSSDGINWIVRSAAGDNDSWQEVVYGNGLFVAVGDTDAGTDKVITSPDGITWTARPALGNNDAWNGITYGNGLFVAVSELGDRVMTSPDGITWTARTAAGDNDNWRDVTYANDLFVAVGLGSDYVMTSPDGINWTARSAAGNNDAWTGITYGNGLFVAVGQGSSPDLVMTSPDGITWTARSAAGDNDNWQEVVYGNGLFVAVGSTATSDRVITSPDGITWTVRSAAGNNDTWRGIAYANGMFIAVGTTGDLVMTSGQLEQNQLAANSIFQGGLNAVGSLSVGTTTSTSSALLGIYAYASSSNFTSLFNIASTSVLGGAATNLFSISNTGSTTAANGFNITNGCYAVNDVCLTSGGGGASFGKSWEVFPGGVGSQNYLAPTSSIGIVVNSSSTISALASIYGTTTNATSTSFFATFFNGTNATTTYHFSTFSSSTNFRTSNASTSNLFVAGKVTFGTSTIHNLTYDPTAQYPLYLRTNDPDGALIISHPAGGFGSTNINSNGIAIFPDTAGVNRFRITNSSAISNTVFAISTEAGSNGYGTTTSYGDFVETPWAGDHAGVLRVVGYNGNSILHVNTDTAAGAVGFASTSPFAQLSIHAVNGSTKTTLFAIGSSTANSTSTLFSVSNTGLATALGLAATNATFLSATATNFALMGVSPNGVLYTDANGTVFATTSLTDAYIADDITVSNGNILGGNISGTLVTTGMLTIGDGGDRIDINSSGWDVINSVFTGGTWQGNVINPQYGGTGNSAIPNDGEILIGDGIGYTLTTLTAGAGISITNGTGAITIANSSTTQWNNNGSSIYYNTGNVGVGTSSPFARLSIMANNGDTNTTLFAIGSSTSATSTNLLLVDNTGTAVFAGPVYSKGITWKSASSTAAITWTGITYGNGLFVAVSSNSVMTSSDGIAWTVHSQSSSMNDVTYGNGLFVGVTNSGNRVLTSSDGINWTQRSVPYLNSWQAITYAEGLFVAVGTSGAHRVMTSPDGITWTGRTVPATPSLGSITYGNGLFVALSSTNTNRAYSSTDGITWTASTAAGDDDFWQGVAYGNGLFVAVSDNGDGVMTSPDGVIWTARSAVGDNDDWNAITYGNGLFVAVGDSGDNIMTSPDGITWTAHVNPEENAWFDITYGNGVFVAVSFDGTNRVMTSGQIDSVGIANNNIYQGGMSVMGSALSVGTTSTSTALLFVHGNGTSSSYANLFTVGSSTAAGVYSNLFTISNTGNTSIAGTLGVTGLVTGTNGFLSNASSSLFQISSIYSTSTNSTSTNLFSTFSSSTNFRAQNASTSNLYVSGLVGIGTTSPYAKLSVQANAADTNPFLFVIGSSTSSTNASTTNLLTVDNTGTAVFAGPVYSKGISWTTRSAAEANQWYGIAYGNGTFVAVSTDGTNSVMTSSDGVVWTARSAAEANQWFDVTYGAGLFVAVSNFGVTAEVMTSPDGITWTARRSAGSNDQVWGVTYGNGLFVAVGINGDHVQTSPDGITWTARPAAGEDDWWTSVTYGNGTFVAVSQGGGGTDRVMTSPDGIIWTARSAAGNNDNWQDVTYGNGVFVAVGNSGDRAMTSPDGITWTVRSAAGDNDTWDSIIYGNGLFVAVGDFGDHVMTSPDGIIWTARSAAGNVENWNAIAYGNGVFAAVGESTNRIMTSGQTETSALTTNNIYQGGLNAMGSLSVGTTTATSSALLGIYAYASSSNFTTLFNIASNTTLGGIPTNLFTVLNSGNTSIAGTLGVTGLVTGTNGFLSNASSSLFQLSSIYSTSTNATSTNLFAINGNFTNATTTNLAVTGQVAFTGIGTGCLQSNAGIISSSGSACGGSNGVTFQLMGTAPNQYLTPTSTIGIAVNASSSIYQLSTIFGTTTNSTSTNLFATNFNGTNATATNLFAITGNFTNATSTNLFASFSSSTNFRATNATTSNLYTSGIFGIGTTSPASKLAIHANIGDTITNLLTIGSSTSATTTTLLTVDNTGTAIFAGPVYSKGITWTPRTAAGDNDSWNGVTYGNGLFVAIANTGGTDKVMTSPDGITWTVRSAAGNDDGWSGITYGNGLFVAVSGSGDRVMTSPDGITWTARSAVGDDDTWQSVAYGNGLFVAVAFGGTDRVMTSPDGITWTARSAAGNDDQWDAITYGNGLFVAVSQSIDRVMTSPDGITWTVRSAAGNDDSWFGITYGNGLFVAVGDTGGTDKVITSPDGITWTARSAAGNNDNWHGVVYGNGLFVAVGNTGDIVMSSPDGITWTARSAASNDDSWRAVTYANGTFVSVGQSGDRVMTSGQIDSIGLAHNNIFQGGMSVMGGTFGIGTTSTSSPFALLSIYAQASSSALTTLFNIASTSVLGGPATNLFTISNTGIASTTGLVVSNAGGTPGCATFSATGVLSNTGTACGAGGSSFGKSWEVFTGGAGTADYLAPTTTIGIVVNASSTLAQLTTGRLNFMATTSTSTLATFGNQSFIVASTTGFNTGVGLTALAQMTSGNNNTALGYGALLYATSTARNVAIGAGALSGLTANSSFEGTDNTAVGYRALMLGGAGNGSFNVGVGSNAFNGGGLLNGSRNIGIGPNVFTGGSNSGDSNIGIGSGVFAGGSVAGSRNIGIGQGALSGGTVAGTASDNIGIGYEAMGGNNLGGIGNIGIGRGAMGADSVNGNHNTALGFMSGYQMTQSSSENLFLGAYAGSNLQSGRTFGNNIGIGYNTLFASTTGSNQLSIANILFGTLAATTSTSTAFTLPTSGGIGIASTSPMSLFAIHANNGDTRTTLFNIGSSTANSTTTLLTFLNNGNLGIGSSTPYAKLSVSGNIVGDYFTSTATTSTSTFVGGLNVGSGALTYDFSSGVTSIQNLAVGAQNFDTDSGIISWIDMPVTSGATHGTVESYTAQLDGNPALTIFGTSNGVGGIYGPAVGIGSSTPMGTLSIEQQATNSPVFIIGDAGTSSPLLVVNSNGTVGFGVGGIYASASSTLAQLSSIYSTSTNATSTNLNVSGTLSLTGAATGCLQSTNGIISSTGTACGSGGGATFGKSWEVFTGGAGTANYLAPTTTIGIVVNASSTLAQLTTGRLNFMATTSTSTLMTFGGGTFLTASTTGQNTSLGIDSMTNMRGGYSLGIIGGNTALGYLSLNQATSTRYNTAIGAHALTGNGTTNGSFNTAVGGYALENSLGSYNTAVGAVTWGDGSPSAMTGSFNTALGSAIGINGTIGGNSNIGVGHDIFVGGNLSGSGNIGIGEHAYGGGDTDANFSTLIGYRAGNVLANNSGQNTLLGAYAGQNLISNSRNNIIIGFNALATSSSASNFLNIGNVLFGTLPATTSATSLALPTTGGIGIGSTSPLSLLSIHANAGDARTNLFSIGSSTANSTTTLLTVDNNGTAVFAGSVYTKGITWTARSAVSASSWYSVAYGNGTFVAVAAEGLVMTSPDGINWTSRTASAGHAWTDVTYGNGLFVAVGNGGVMTSPDGISWVTRTQAEPNSWRTVTYGNGLFVALSITGGNRIMTSQDGITWTSRSAPTVESWLDAVYGNGVFVAVGNTGSNRNMYSLDGITWTSGSSMAGFSMRGVAYGNGTFVAVGASGAVFTSPDGITWSSRTAAEANSFESVAYGNGLFVAISSDGSNRVMTSPNGITWTSRSATAANTWQGIGYGNGTFVALSISGTNRVMTSGQIEANLLSANNIFQGGLNIMGGLSIGTTTATTTALFSVVAQGSSSPFTNLFNIGSTSAAGITSSLFSVSNTGIASTTGLVVSNAGGVAGCATFSITGVLSNTGTACGSGGGATFGKSWEVNVGGAGSVNYLAPTTTIGIVVNASSSIFALNGYLGTTTNATSTNLFATNANFTNATATNLFATLASTTNFRATNATTSNLYTSGLVGVGTTSGYAKLSIHANVGDTNPLLFAIGSSTAASTTNLLTVDNTGTAVFAGPVYSKGITWTPRSAAGNNDSWSSVTYGNGLFVAVGQSGDYVMTSPDGINWTARNAAGNNDFWTAVTYGNGLFVAVGMAADRVMTSPDGINWTVRSAAGNDDSWFGITYGNGLFVAVAGGVSGDHVMTSPDGITWTGRTAAGDNDVWAKVTYGNGLFVAVGDSSGAGDSVITSPDGITWTIRSMLGDNDTWNAVTYGNGLFVAVSSVGDRVMTSPDGTTWTARSAVGDNDEWYSVTYGNGLFVAGGGNTGDRVMTSPDGINWTARFAAGNDDNWGGITYGNGLFVAVSGLGSDYVITSGQIDSIGLAHNNIFQGGMSVMGGTFGVGTTSTSSLLNIFANGGSSSFTNLFNISSSTAAGVVSNLFTITNTGSVGIGSTTPYGKLSVDTTGLGTTPAFVVGSSSMSSFMVSGDGRVLMGTTSLSGLSIASTTTRFLMQGGAFTQQYAASGTLGSVAIVGTVVDGSVMSSPQTVVVSGKYAYVVTGTNANFRIIDISNPASPVMVGGIESTTLFSDARGVAVSGKYAYVVDIGSQAMYVIDISRPAAPFIANSIPVGVSAVAVQVQGKYAYVVGSNSLKIVDISNPLAPSVVGTFTDATNLASAQSVAVQGRYAYVGAFSDNSLRIIDISNPTSPVMVGGIKDNTNLALINAVAVSGRYAYVTSLTSTALRIIDIQNPLAPTIVGGFSSAALLTGAQGVAVAGHHAYVTATGVASGGMRIFDVASSTNPILVGGIRDSSRLGGARSVAVSGRYAYVAAGSVSTMAIIDLGGFDTPAANIGALAAGSVDITNLLTAGSGIFGGLSVGDGGFLSQGGGSFALHATTSLLNTPALTATVNDTNLSSIIDALSLTHTATGTIANGIGTGLLFNTEYNVAGAPVASTTATSTARIAALLTDVTGTSPQSALSFFTKSGTTNLAERMRLTAQGNLGIGSTSPYANLSIHANNGELNTTLFSVGSSTANSTSTLFTISNTGIASTTGLVVSNAGGVAGCATFSVTGVLSNTGTACGSGGGATFGKSWEVNVGGAGSLNYLAPTSTIGIVVNASSSIFALNGFLGTTTNATSTNLFATNFRGTNATTSNLYVSGLVGIGTTSPAQKFPGDILSILGSGSTGSIIIGNSSSDLLVGNQGTNAQFRVLPSSNNIYLENSNPSAIDALSVGAIVFRQNYGGTSNERMRIAAATGYVGIGTTSPYANLSIHANAGETNRTLFAVGSSTANSTSTLFSILNTGKVGIGSSSPTAALSIGGTGGSGGINIGTNGGNYNGISLTGGSLDNSWNLLGSASDQDLYVKSSSAGGDIWFQNGGATAELMTIRGSGNVGIGTSSPSAKLSVHALNGDTNTTLFAVGSSTANSTTTLFRVMNTGQVAIGDASGFYGNQLVVHGDTYLEAGNLWLDPGKGLNLDVNDGGEYIRTTSQNSADMVFTTNGVARMFLAASGGLGIGTTSPMAKLAIHATPGSPTTTLFAIASSTANSTTTLFTISNTGIASTTGLVVSNAGGVAGCATFSATGVLSNTGSACGSGGGATFGKSWEVFTGGAGTLNYLSPTTTTMGIVVNASSTISALSTILSTSTNATSTNLFATNANFANATATNFFATTGSSTNFNVSNMLGIGTTSPTSLLGMQKTGISGNGVAGISQYFNFQNTVGSAVQYGDSTYIVNAPTTANTLVGKVLRIEDNTALVNTVRGLEVQAHRGTNTQGENTAISGFGRTFGVRGTTEGDAGSVFEPAGIYGETRGTAQSNAIRGYSGTITSSDLFALEQGSSTFTGAGLAMNFGNTGGSFNASTSRFLDLKNAGVTKFVVMASGTVGIGTSSPWGFLSINPDNFGGPSFVIGSSTKSDFIITNAGDVGIGTSTPSTKLEVSGTGNQYLRVTSMDDSNVGIDLFRPGNSFYDWDISNVSGDLRFRYSDNDFGSITTRFIVTGDNGRVGIGTTSPFAKLSLVSGTTANETNPLFWFATTSDTNGLGQRPILWGFATTTGDLNRERVAIGTTSVWGTGGIRDSLTVDGRIYSTWMNLNCVAGSSMGIGTTSADGPVCGDFGLDINSDGALVAQNSYPPKARLRTGFTTTFVANEAAYLRTGGLLAAATSSPVMEARVGIPRGSQFSTTSRVFIVGFTDTVSATTTFGSLPTNGVFFSASSSPNWFATIRRNGVSTGIDTGISTTTGPTASDLQRMRIEVTGTNATFLVNGTVRAVITPGGGMPVVPMAPLVGIYNTGVTTAAGMHDIDIGYIQAWIDDPIGNDGTTLAEAGVGELSPRAKEDTRLSLVNGADIAEQYLVASSSQYLPGMLVTNATDTPNMVGMSSSTYQSNVMGVVSTNPHTVLGQNDSYLVKVALLGRAPVIVSLENGPISKGDAIVASAITGVGMRGIRPGTIVGHAFESIGYSQCNADLKEELEKVGVELPENACLVKILMTIEPGFSINNADMFSEIAPDTTFSMVGLATELMNSAYIKGAELTRFVVGQVTAQVAFIGQIFSNEVHTKSLCVADEAGSETCLTKAQLDALILNAGSGSTTITPPPPDDDDGGTGTTTDDGGGTGTTTPDTEAPVVNLVGPSSVTVTVDASYNDEGATVSDNVDTNLSYITLVDGIEISPAIFDLHTPTVHTITYRATDAAGNVGEVTRTVEVVAAPTPEPEPEPVPQPEPPAEDPPPADEPPPENPAP